MMRLQCLLFFFTFCAALSGCAVREPLAPAPAASESILASQSFNEQVAALPEGSTQYFAESPFGPATIETGPLYLSGLGNECRSARVTRGTLSHRFVLCKEENGRWHFIPTIFESMPR